MKCAAVIVGLLCLLTLSMASQANKAPTQGKQSTEPKGPSSLSPENHTITNYYAEHPHDESPKWYAALKRPDWWLVIIAAFTGFAIAYQAREMTLATGEMRKSADAAVKSSAAWMAGERAWILSEVKDVKVVMHAGYAHPVLTSFDLHFRNHGRTPGRITRTSAWLDAVENLEALPLTPDYRNIETHTDFPIPVVTGKSHAMLTAFNDRFLRENEAWISQGDAIQCVYGFIEYVDIFGDPHETRFCYKYTLMEPPGKPLSHGLTHWGHPEYNRAT